MSTHLAQVESSEEEKDRNGSVRPSELSLVVGGGLAPPSASHTPRNRSPVTVQEWVDSLPLTPTEVTRAEEEGEPRIVLTQDTDDNLTLGAEAGLMCGPLAPAVQVTSDCELIDSCREPSESGSHCSSVESLLEARKADPEEVLLNLGFGGSNHNSECRIPQRFLQPSKLRGVAIDDFLRHQQEMVQNFETGFCGYRGLSGPSHTMPSVIVAKIMEKLREHERESSSTASPPHASSNTDRNKFSRVARNVLTKIKCVPGTSVLTPDNRKWLDSQGHKSPEISRKRIIIGQQSFTFGRDGDLIESRSPPSSLTDSDSRWTSGTGTPGHLKAELTLDKPGFPSIQEDVTEPSLPPPSPQLIHPPKHAFANVVTSLLAEKNQESKLSSSSVEVSEEDKQWSRSLGDGGLPSSGRSSRGLDDCDSPVNVTEVDAPATTCDSQLDSIYEECKPLHESVLDSENSFVKLPRSNEGGTVSSQENDFCSAFVCEKLKRTLESNTGNLSSTLSLPLTSRHPDSISGHCAKSESGLESVCENVNPDLEDSISLPISSDFTLGNKDLTSKVCDSRVSGKHGIVPDEVKASIDAILPVEQSEGGESVVTGSDCNVVSPVLACGLEDSSPWESLPPSSEHTSLPSTSATSPWPSLASELEDTRTLVEQAVSNERVSAPAAGKSCTKEQVKVKPPSMVSAPVRVIESLDKVIESLEKIMEPLEVITETDCTLRTQSDRGKVLRSYEDLKLLVEQLLAAGVSVDVGSPDQFISLTVNERCALQCRVVRQALSAYQTQLAMDTSHYELKRCLSDEVHRLSDLLDTTADPDKLSTLVQQVRELLKHQAELSSQLQEWSSESPHEPVACHQLCQVVLRRLRALELIVQNNTRTLSRLRNQI